MAINFQKLSVDADHAVSIYVDLEPQQRDLRHPRLHLARLIEDARARLMERGASGSDCGAILSPLETFASSDDLAGRRDPAIALFAARDSLESVRLPVAIADNVVVAGHFHIKPLLAIFGPNLRFHVLALSSTSARLFTASRYEIHERTPEDLPRSVEQVMAESELQTGAPHTPIMRPRNRGPAAVPTSRGFESPEDVHKVQLIEHIARLEGSLVKHLAQDNAPILLFAEPQVGGHLRQRGHLRNLVGEMISANPHGLSDDEIHRRAVEVMQPYFDAPVAHLIDRISARLGSGANGAATKPEDVVAAAHFGRVDAALVAADATLWGTFDAASGAISAHGSPVGWDEDLLNLAAVRTIANGGPVFAVPRDRLPQRALAAAALRY